MDLTLERGGGGAAVDHESASRLEETINFVTKVKKLLTGNNGDLSEAFLLHCWKLYLKGYMGKHDFYCEIADLLLHEQQQGGQRDDLEKEIQDLLNEMKGFLLKGFYLE